MNCSSRFFSAIQNSVRIALVHHHVLPIPHAGRDTFLVLEDAQRLLQFLAEKHVSMVLHGHKHHAAYSLLCLRGSSPRESMIEVLGAGAAVLSGTDHDPRGHNFNLICIEDNGLRYVRQFFAPPNQDFDELLDTGYPTQSFELSYQRAWKMGYRYRTIHWSLDIDVEGDRFNEIVYTGVAVDPKSDLKSFSPLLTWSKRDTSPRFG